ncbi:hypothetical protein [Clostridium lacusfryxellense]|uniref:hypothetical protein n=1 Tax=Clostridium lacusfryxellense TaxID=205328 RepID=UPI001C0DBADA|nr:hypothetical protein [Clostridium lacusfryxellense]MBU3114387.1 hypothetical protein [Clostridium lacusfryxellense]
MKICSPCLFYDDENHLWRFYVNDSKELMYSIMYDEDRWTKEIKIDNKVLDFIVNFDTNNKIYIIYSVTGSDLKYCVWEKNKWYGKTIYSFENEEYEMTGLNVITIGKLTHIFFIGRNNKNKIQCSLMHLCLNEEGNSFNIIDTITFLEEVSYHYQLQSLENDNLSLIYIKPEKNEVIIKYTEFKESKWSASKRLYGIIGNSINFCTLVSSNKINIMNLSKEGSFYFIEHVVIEPDGKMKSYKIQESSNKPINFLLIEISGVLWSIWTEGNTIFTSSYSNQWSEQKEIYSELNNEFLIYKYLCLSNKNSNLKCKYILGTPPPKIDLLLPDYKIINNKSDFQQPSIPETEFELESDLVINKLDIRKELSELRINNINLQKDLIDLQLKYQQKLRIIEESENDFFKLTNAKKKAEEKLNIIAEIQQTSIKKLKVMEIEKLTTDLVLNELKDKSKHLTNEYEGLIKQKISKDIVVNELNDRLQQLITEKEGLRQDLKYEKNIGIVDRIFKKRPDR